MLSGICVKGVRLSLFLSAIGGCSSKSTRSLAEEDVDTSAVADATAEGVQVAGGNILTALAGAAGATAEIEGAGIAGLSHTFARGADVSWLSMMESYGYKWIDDAGQPQDALTLLRDKGVNAIRIRALVDPPASGLLDGGEAIGFCNTASVVKQAQRAQAAGMRIMVDLMLSDTWTDPGHQSKPAAWASLSLMQLETAVSTYASSVVNALKAAGIAPEWVQIGNEITGGLLWPDGKYDQFAQLARLVNAGYKAVKSVSPDSKVVVHLDNGFKNSQYRWWFDNFTKEGGMMDVIGMSCYPTGDDVATLAANMADVISRYAKPVVIAEFGMPSSDATAAYNTLVAVQKAVAALPDRRGQGVFYWEPEHAPLPVFGGYNLGASRVVADHTLQFTTAINAFSVPVANDPTSPIDPASVYELFNTVTGKVLNVAGGSTADVGLLEQRSDNKASSQEWHLAEGKDGFFTLKNDNSGLLLDVPAFTTVQNAPIIQYRANGGTNQQWKLLAQDGGGYRLISRSSGKALAVLDRNTADGAAVVQSTVDGDDIQVWQLQPVGASAPPKPTPGPAPPPPASAYSALLAAFFTSSDETGLYYAISSDGYKFAQNVKNGGVILHSTLDDGLLRDPDILRDATDTFHLIATVSNTHPKFQIYDSDDLITWKNGRLVDVSIPNTNSSTCWAPELFYDPAQQVYFAHWTSTPNKVWNDTSIFYAKTTDFIHWTAPAVLLKDPGGAVMDADIKAFNGQYVMVYRFNSQVWQRTASSALGPYLDPTLIFNDNVEGPYAFNLKDNAGLGIVFDQFGGNQGRWGVGQANSSLSWGYVTQKNWPYYNAQAYFPAGVRHGSVIPITTAESQAIVKALGAQTIAGP